MYTPLTAGLPISFNGVLARGMGGAGKGTRHRQGRASRLRGSRGVRARGSGGLRGTIFIIIVIVVTTK